MARARWNGLGSREQVLDGWERRGTARLQPLEPASTNIHSRTEQRPNLPISRLQVDRRRGQRPPFRRDAVDAPVTPTVLHLMAADDGIEPVGDVERAVCADGDIARPEPFAPILVIDPIPDVVRIRRREARHDLESLQREAGAARLRVKTKDDVAARIGAQQHALIPSPEQVALVADDAGRRAGAGVVAGRQDAGVVLVPVCGERILTRTSIGLPERECRRR